MAKKAKLESGEPSVLTRDPVTTEIAAAAARGVGQACRFLSRQDVMGPGVRVEVLDRGHFVVYSESATRHVRVTEE